MRVLIFILLGICFMFYGHTGYSQITNVAFERISTKEGLSQSTVNYIIQDRKGFMWFATYGGINKYDGYTFKAFRNIANNKTSLSNNGIVYLYEDNEGFIWAMNNANKGLDKFDPKTEKFIRYNHNSKDTTSLSSNEVYHVTQDKLGNIWICTKNALNLLIYKRVDDKVIPQFKRFYNTTNKQGFSMTYENRDGKLLLFADSLYYFDRRTSKIKSANLLLNRSVLKSISEDTKGNLWLGTEEDGIIKLAYNRESKSYTRAQINKAGEVSNNRNYVLVDNNENIWICTETKGLIQYNEKEDSYINYLNDKNNLNSISDNSIYSLCVDRSGVLWIGTFSQGLCKYNLYQKQFLHFKSIVGNSNSLIGNVISSIHSSKHGELWVGIDSYEGVNRLIFRDNKEPLVIHYKNDLKRKGEVGSNRTLCLVQRKNGEVWLGSADETISKIIPENPGPKELPITKKFKVARWTFSIYEDSKGILWGGTWGGGLWRFDDKTLKFSYFKNDPSNPFSLGDNIVWAISEDKFGNIWIGGHGDGLSILPIGEKNKYNPHFINFKHEEGNIKSLSDNTIHAFLKDHSGTMWIGTSGGLNKVIRKNNNRDIGYSEKLEFMAYHIKDGLPSEAIVGILEDNSGNLWISTSNGLSKFSVAKGSFVNFDDKDGLQSNEFWHNSYFRDQNGRMYFGGQNGFNAFYPDSIKTSHFLPQVVFTDIKIFNKSVAIGERLNGDIIISKSMNQTSKIVLSHMNNAFTLEFASLHYTQPKKNQYAFMLEGYDKNWSYVGNKREATYTNLDPGNYNFRVKASNNDGIWNENSAAVEITILPPWWKTVWFRMLVITLLILMLVMVFYLKMANYKKRQTELKHLVHIRTQELEHTNRELREERVHIEEQKRRIEDYSEEVSSQNEELKNINEQLLGQQSQIEEQSEELQTRSEKLKEINDLLLEKQRLIQLQADSLQQSNQELSVLNSTKDRFFSIIAHDLRNPFHAVSGFSELLLRDYSKLPPEKIEKFLSLINRSSMTGNVLLENLLQWSRSQTGNISYDPAKLNLLKVAEEVVDLLEGEVHRKNIQIIQEIGSNFIVFVDENMLKTILRNLISNAIKFTKEKGKITLKAREEAPLVEVSVIDTGIGISSNKISLLFNVETNISTKGTASETGTGLGLILCKEFVEKNGGQIWVESKSNLGSEFKFTLRKA